jgi:hypothetical protein
MVLHIQIAFPVYIIKMLLTTAVAVLGVDK